MTIFCSIIRVKNLISMEFIRCWLFFPQFISSFYFYNFFVLVYLPSHSPQINPTELCFNTVRHLTEKSQSRNDKELNDNIVKIINILNQKNMTKYFHRCRDYFSFDKRGN